MIKHNRSTKVTWSSFPIIININGHWIWTTGTYLAEEFSHLREFVQNSRRIISRDLKPVPFLVYLKMENVKTSMQTQTVSG